MSLFFKKIGQNIVETPNLLYNIWKYECVYELISRDITYNK